jgi:phosphonate transport system permease protein
MATESSSVSSEDRRTWERPSAFYNAYTKYFVYGIVLAFVVWSLYGVGWDIQRIIAGWSELTAVLGIAWPPNFGDRFLPLYFQGVYESIGMAVLATLGGVVVSIPFAFMGAGNIAPRPLYYFARGMFIFTRAFHSLIVGIVFVTAVGTGVFAGILTFMFSTIGYWSKLLAEDIEDISARKLDAIRAVGASPIQVLTYAVVPQVKPRAVGLTIYRWDSNIRGSVIIGIVGAGGIGLTLLNSYRRYEYDVTLAILIIIVVIVLIGEVLSAYIRGRVQ